MFDALPPFTISYIPEAKAKVTMNNQGIHEDASKKSAVRVSALPKDIQADAMKLDLDGDGVLDTMEMGVAFKDLKQTKKDNRSLKNTIAAFAILTTLLISGMFASSIAAARLAKDVKVSSDNGFAYVKGSDSNQVMKTAEALVLEEGANIGLLSNDHLQRLTQVIFMDGDLKFNVKGYSRGNPTGISETIMLLVEGGTITYDDAGIIDSTGNAQALLDHAFGQVAGSDGDRRLNDQKVNIALQAGMVDKVMVTNKVMSNSGKEQVYNEDFLSKTEKVSMEEVGNDSAKDEVYNKEDFAKQQVFNKGEIDDSANEKGVSAKQEMFDPNNISQVYDDSAKQQLEDALEDALSKEP